MEEKTIVDWEKENLDTPTQPVGGRRPAEEHGEPIEFRQRVGSVEFRHGVGSDDEEEATDLNLDEELVEGEKEDPNEPTGENRGR